MTDEKRRGLTLADVDGLPAYEPPDKFPIVVQQTPSAAVLAIAVAIWPGNPDFRKMCVSVSNKSARSKSARHDKGQAAQIVWEFAVANKVTALTSLDPPMAKAKIADTWLPNALKKANLGRQAILLQMRTEGQAAEELRAATAAARGGVPGDDAEQAA